MMKFFILSVLAIMMSTTQACDFSNPHSLSCQKQTFDGRIFPLDLIDFRLFNSRWIPSQFTSVDRRHPLQFGTLRSRSVRHRTCGVLNPDGHKMGNMNVRFSSRGIEAVSVFSFLGSHFMTDRRPHLEDAFTLVFGGRGGRDMFRCRVFDRVGISHLTCQYYRNNRFVGYLGFLPHETSCE